VKKARTYDTFVILWESPTKLTLHDDAKLRNTPTISWYNKRKHAMTKKSKKQKNTSTTRL